MGQVIVVVNGHKKRRPKRHSGVLTVKGSGEVAIPLEFEPSNFSLETRPLSTPASCNPLPVLDVYGETKKKSLIIKWTVSMECEIAWEAWKP